MKVKVVAKFRDITANLKLREVGKTLTVTQERAEHLKKLGLVEIIEDDTPEKDDAEAPAEAAAEPATAPKRKTKTAKTKE